MKSFFYVLPVLSVFLEGLVFWRLSRHRLAFRYPYFGTYVFYTFLRDVSLFPISRYRPDLFAEVYWRTEVVSLFFRFFVNWEFFRGVFPKDSILRDIAWKILWAVEAVVLPAILLLTWNQASSSQYHHLYLRPIFEQYLSLAQAFLLLVPAGVAWYYGVPLGRNTRGLGLGFGVYLSVSAINFGSLQVFDGFFPYGRFLSPAAFIGMIVVWLWAFWEYRPSSELPGASRTHSDYWPDELAAPLDSARRRTQKRGASI
jgi:hypothetical protein